LRRRLDLADALTLIAMLAAVYGLKRFHAQATPEDLHWILAPSAALAGVLTGGSFVAEAGVGWVSNELRFAIVPPCAGVNFLAITFCTLMTVLGLGRALVRERIAAAAIAAALAYAAAVVANGIRIAVAVLLHVHRIELGPLDGARLHRLEGVVVYLAILIALFDLAQRWKERHAT
jgi:exosortase K